MHDFPDRPRFISIEENQTYYFAELWAVGCRGFKLINQRDWAGFGGLHREGTGTLDGLDATVDLILGTGAPETSAVSLTLDDETRERWASASATWSPARCSRR